MVLGLLRGRRPVAAAAGLLVVAVLAVLASGGGGSPSGVDPVLAGDPALLPVGPLPIRRPDPRAPAASVRPDFRLTLVPRPVSPPVPGGFVGLSIEYPGLMAYAGGGHGRVDPLLAHLLDAVAGGGRPVLRIGGYSTDRSWWPPPGRGRPAGIVYALGPGWARIARQVASAAHARLILGINLELGRPAAAAYEARQLVRRLGRRLVLALEIGNEPSIYSQVAYYRRRGRRYFGRGPRYGFGDFLREYRAVAARLPRLPLAGPALNGFGWMPGLPAFLASEPRVRIVTMHRYPLDRCHYPRTSPRYPTIPRLLDPSTTRAVLTGLPRYVQFAHAHGARFRVDELNSVACEGLPGVSDRFAAALWSLDALFSLLADGVDGVNFHMLPRASYGPFTLQAAGHGWQASPRPLLYALLMFARAAPAGSRMLALQGPRPTWLRAWATAGPDPVIRVLVADDSPDRSVRLLLRLPARGTAWVQRLRAPGLAAAEGERIAGQGYGAVTDTARLRGIPALEAAVPAAGGYELEVPAASAALLVVRRSG